MASAVSLKMIGDWRSAVGVPLRDALAVSMDVIGRTGEEACRHALILMAQSARAMAKKAPARRPVKIDVNLHGSRYVDTWQQGDAAPKRLYEFRFSSHTQASQRLQGTWDDAKKIGNRGLAQRSWMWGLGRLGGHAESSPIAGTSRVYTITSETVNGYIKENRLAYIQKAMPVGWEAAVEQRAGNKIMAQARGKLQRQWVSAMHRRERAVGRGVQSFFLKGLAS